MESLSQILSGETVPDTQASASEAPGEPTKDVKPPEADQPAEETSAPSAEQATTGDAKAEGESKDPEGEAKPDASRDDKGRFVKPDEKDKSKPDEVASLRKALQAERKKRQELEKKEPPKDEKPKKDFWEDPEGAIEERLSAREQTIRRETEARFFALCERQAKAKHNDYEAVVESLIEETDGNPILAQQVFSQARESDDPAEFLYSYATHRREMKAVGGDLGKYKSSIEAPHLERIGKLEEENKALKDKLEKLGKIPSSLNAQPSATRAAVESEAVEDDSLEEITKPRKRRA